MEVSEILKLKVSKVDVIKAVKKALEHRFIDNLRNRHQNVSFDSKLRGYVGEIAMKNWFEENGISVNTPGGLDQKRGVDTDFSYKGLDFELKTSLVPDEDQTLAVAFRRRDLKIIRRRPKPEELKSDLHLQVFFDHRRRQKDEWLKQQEPVNTSMSPEDIYEALMGRSYLNRTYFFGWTDKSTLIKNLSKLPQSERTWGYAKREFWKCPLQQCKPPHALPGFLSEYS